MTPAAPAWADAITAALVLLGAISALVGSLGVFRFPTFPQRVHAPTLGSTSGTWSLAVATVLHLSFARGAPFVHALLIPIFVALTAPVTTIFLMRAALFRKRAAGREVPRPLTR